MSIRNDVVDNWRIHLDSKAKLFAECSGTYVLVFGGTGSAVLAAKFLDPTGTDAGLGIGFVGVALAFGLTVVTMAYAVGLISGGAPVSSSRSCSRQSS